MSINTRVHFHNMEGSPALEAAIHKHIEKLQRFYAHILAFDVSVESPHHHQHKGSSYRVVIRIAVPGDTLVVSHERGKDPAHEDCYVAINDAFHSARRRLQDYARIQRQQVKHHANAASRRSTSSESAAAQPDTDEPDTP